MFSQNTNRAYLRERERERRVVTLVKSRSLGLAVRGNESLERVQLLLKRGEVAEALLTAEAEAEAEARDEAIAERETSRERERE
jgi:hypothetical protein